MAEIVDGKAVLVGPDGGLVQVDPKSVDAKVSTGLYKEASPELIAREDQAIAAAEARRKHDEELTSVGAQLETGIKTGLNAVAAPAVWAAQKLGLGDIRNIGMTDSEAAAYHQREAELAAANPIAAGVGEVAGQAVLAGAGGVSAGARALAGRATTSALGRATAGAALEGGALGAAQAMEDPYADAQHVLAGGALGAVLGGGIGAATHGAQAGLAKVFGRPAIEEQAVREARASMQRDAMGEGEALWDKVTAKASGAPKDLVEEFGVKNPQARKAAIDAVAHFDRYTEETAFKMQNISRELTQSVDDVLEQVRSSAMKREGISKLMGQELERAELPNRTAHAVMEGAGKMYSELLGDIKPIVASQKSNFVRFTHTDNPMSQWDHAMFGRYDANISPTERTYGSHQWEIDPNAKLTNVLELRKAIESAAEEHGLPRGYDDVDDLMKNINPRDIVDSAGAWDDEDFMRWFYEHIQEQYGISGVETRDGAVVFDKSLIRKAVTENATEAARGINGLDRASLPEPLQRRLRALDRYMSQRMRAFDEAKDLSSKHALMNQTKQDFDKVVRQLRQSANHQNLLAPDKEAFQEVADKILKISDELRSTLESPRIWGEKAAAAQKEVNAGWHEGGVDAMNAFGNAFERNTGKIDFETGRNVYDADAIKFKAAVSGFGRTSGDVAERAMQDYITNMRRMIDTVDKRYDLTAGKIRSLDTAKARLDELEKLYQNSSKHIGMVNRWKELGNYGAAASKNSALTGAIIGGGFGPLGALGAVAGSAFEAAANPTGRAANIANALLSKSVFQARERVASSLTNKVTKWIDSGGKQPSSLRADITSSAITAFRGKYGNDDKATQARIEQIQEFDPAGISEHASDLPADVAMQAGMVAQKAVDYLRSKIPPYMSAPSLVRSGRAPVMSRPDQIQFARVMGTVLDPTTAAKDLIAGRLTPGQVDALREVYPSIYDDLRVSAVAALGARNAKSEPMPAQVRQQLSMLLDLGDAGDPVLSGQVADRIAQQVASSKAEQAQQAQQAQKQRPPSGGPSKLAQAARSPLESDMQQ